MMALRRVLAWAPARCEICRAWPAQAVCRNCARAFGDAGRGIGRRCATCALPVPGDMARCAACRLRPPPLDACHAALPYGYPWDSLITRLKFGGEPGLAGPLGRLMHAQPGVREALAQADTLLPMPLSASRLRERGYNQAQALARVLAPALACSLAPRALRRTRDTAPQTDLGRADRERNLRHAFAVNPAHAATIAGQRVLLLDDVMTSGATLHEAARVLRRAGAARVSALVLARTDLP